MIRLLAFLVLGFKIWMLTDAYQRRAETYWTWIIVGVPGGALAYLFMVRLKSRDAQSLQRRVVQQIKGPTSVEDLRYRFERSPSLSHRLQLAQGLADAGQWSQAREHFQAILRERPEEWDATFGQAVCDLETEQNNAAIAGLGAVPGFC